MYEALNFLMHGFKSQQNILNFTLLGLYKPMIRAFRIFVDSDIFQNDIYCSVYNILNKSEIALYFFKRHIRWNSLLK